MDWKFTDKAFLAIVIDSKSSFTNKGSSRRPEKVVKTGSIFMGRGMGRGSAGANLRGMGRGSARASFKGMGKGQGYGKVDGQGQCRGKVEGHGQRQCRGKFEEQGQG